MQVIQYYHAAARFPTKATWLKAINIGFFATWPMLIAKAVAKYFLESNETQKGHMQQQWQGVKSTQERRERKQIYCPCTTTQIQRNKCQH